MTKYVINTNQCRLNDLIKEIMVKRKGNSGKNKGKRTSRASNSERKQEEETKDNLRFEDPFEDEMEIEDVVDSGANGEVDDVQLSDMKMIEEDEDEEEDKTPKQIFRPGIDKLEEGETLDYDESAYVMYHRVQSDWPCLSFDVIRDNLGEGRTRFPMTAYVVCGTQADRAQNNKITIMKWGDLHRNQTEDDDEDDADALDDDPTMDFRVIPHNGGVNRIRAMPQRPHIVATWADTAKVHMWDVSGQLSSVMRPGSSSAMRSQPVQTFEGHPEEGFAMDWSPTQQGRFLSGDCARHIYLWEPTDEGCANWSVGLQPFVGHTASVEDLQWSPNEAQVFMSCSADKTIRVWDARTRDRSMVHVTASEVDVNVISWNKSVPHLVASGADDGALKIWDLRAFRSESPVAHFRWHTKAITSVEWDPNDESVLATSGEDNQITVWDMSLEEDPEAAATAAAAAAAGAPPDPSAELPPQLLFVHQGQTALKELHWHPQLPGVLVSTALDGFNVFKPAITTSS